MKRLTYKDIQDLPQDHPDYIRFMEEAEAECNIPVIRPDDDEEGVGYFNRYIAGDR
jgi:hypothetical protein